MAMLYQRWAVIPVGDRPSKMSISRGSNVYPATLEVVVTYTVRAVNAASPLEVANE